jgi:hypothetical protein
MVRLTACRHDEPTARPGGGRRLHRGPLRRVALGILLTAAVAGPSIVRATAAPTTGSSAGAARAAATVAGHVRQLAGTQITAHDGAFWVGSNQVVLKGFNYGPGRVSNTDLSRMAGWGANFARVRFRWTDLETSDPVWQNNAWKHTYASSYVTQVRQQIEDNWARGIWTLLDNHPCTANPPKCPFFGWPSYLYQATFNSHAKSYAKNADGALDANTDFWTDAWREDHELQMWKYLVSQVKDEPGVMGYEIHNEPQRGNLPNDHATTQTMLDWQLSVAKAIRAIDPGRIIVFTTRAGYGPGLQNADLSGWQSLAGTPTGNVAFDIHDYFGARWADGITENPHNVEYTETLSNLYDHVLDDAAGPYIGNTASQVRFLQQAIDRLHGIPLLVGELGDDQSDPGIDVYYGTTTSAFAYTGVSWAASYGGRVGIVDGNDDLMGFGQLVVDAMGG